jgi:hypothetical protein
MGDAIHSIISIGAPFNMIVLVVLIVNFAWLVGAVAKQTRKWASHRQELEFKRELLDRGMTADEIERILKAQGPAMESRSGCS